MTGELTPFDTGARCEPVPWVHRAGTRWLAGQEYVRPAEPDDFGRVDFDGDDGTTIVTAHVERGDDGEYTLVYYGHGDVVAVRNDSDASEGHPASEVPMPTVDIGLGEQPVLDHINIKLSLLEMSRLKKYTADLGLDPNNEADVNQAGIKLLRDHLTYMKGRNAMNHLDNAKREMQAAFDLGEVPPHDTLDRALFRANFAIDLMYDRSPDPDENDQALRDMLTDLVHYAKAENIDIDWALDAAKTMAHQEETEWAQYALNNEGEQQ